MTENPNRLALVESPAPPNEPPLTVRISSMDGNAAFRRTRMFRLSEAQLETLITVALRMEASR